MLLARKLHHWRRCCGVFPFIRCRPPARLRLLSSLGVSAEGPTPSPRAETPHFTVDYLARSCGLSAAEALQAFEPLSHLDSTEKPDAVLGLLRRSGMGDKHIKLLLKTAPCVLASDAKKTVEPRIKALQAAGFSGTELVQLISLNPFIIYGRDLVNRVKFWRELVGSNQNIFRAMKADARLLSYSLKKKVLPSLSMLRHLGVPSEKIPAVVIKSRLMASKPDKIRTVLGQMGRLGFSPDSRDFVHALSAITSIGGGDLDGKLKFLKSFGWTEAELTLAIHRLPRLLSCSAKKIRSAMAFLLNEAGCSLSYIAGRPPLIALSLEGRLRPRYYVIQCLQKKGLGSRTKSLWSVMQKSEENFITRYIHPYTDQLPELLEDYCSLRARAAKVGTSSLKFGLGEKPSMQHLLRS